MGGEQGRGRDAYDNRKGKQETVEHEGDEYVFGWMIGEGPGGTQGYSWAASDVYERQLLNDAQRSARRI